MLGIKLSVPIACFRKGMAREYLETERIPPPATCYGFLLALVGETDRERHLRVKISPVLLKESERSVVLRTVWRVKKTPLGSPGNTRPDYQQILTDVQLLIWLDSSDEEKHDGTALVDQSLEKRVKTALDPEGRGQIARFGGLSLGESTHLVNEVSLYYDGKKVVADSGVGEDVNPQIMLQDSNGALTWPVWVDHVGAQGTRYVTGALVSGGLKPPKTADMPVIQN
ncbi:MAG: type I-MYXAN CRISPR-associated protein Cas5/Cmx5/DevS [Planctomycetia bacterium]|nr:type I-MYXAN CRISPR-associated protein Cas5/Cmx5/DevS [Planctomycetia bacterium]